MAYTLLPNDIHLINRFAPLPTWVAIGFLVLFFALSRLALAQEPPEAVRQQPVTVDGLYKVVYGCELRAENDTINNQAAVVYYECKSQGSHVSFMLMANTPGAQRMSELTHQTFDILLYRISPKPAPVAE